MAFQGSLLTGNSLSWTGCVAGHRSEVVGAWVRNDIVHSDAIAISCQEKSQISPVHAFGVVFAGRRSYQSTDCHIARQQQGSFTSNRSASVGTGRNPGLCRFWVLLCIKLPSDDLIPVKHVLTSDPGYNAHVVFAISSRAILKSCGPSVSLTLSGAGDATLGSMTSKIFGETMILTIIGSKVIVSTVLDVV
jgi:hypothetical protein